MAKEERALGSVGEGRFYLPPSEAPEDTSTDPVDEVSEPMTLEDLEAAAAAAGFVLVKAEDVADPAAETVQPDPIEAAAKLAQDPPTEMVAEPKGNASREEWATYARSKGAPESELAEDGSGLSRDELREKYGTPAS
jgi:hypothetical protein